MTETFQYSSLREKIAAEKRERQARYAEFDRVFKEASEAGRKAGEANVPVPMIVGQAKSLTSNEIDYTKGPMHYVSDGACGFAWVIVRPATSSFAKWLVKNGHAKTAYYGGVQIWISAHGQSIGRKEAHAYVMAEILRTRLGVSAYSDSRLD